VKARSSGQTLAILSLLSFVMLLGVGIVVPMLPTYALGIGATATQIGLIFAGFSLSRTICTPIIGALADKSELKRLMIIGIIGYSLLSLAYVAARTPLHLILIRTLHGMASAFVIPLAMSYAARIAEEGREGLAMGSINMALFFGMGAGPLIGGILTDRLGPAAAFYALALLSGLSLIVTLGFLPPMGRHKAVSGQGTLKGILKIPTLVGLLLFRMINSLGSGNLMAFIPILAHRAGLSTTAIGILISTNIFITGSLQRPFGRLVTKANINRFILTGSALSIVTLASLPLASGFGGYLILGALMGLGGAISMPAASVLILEHGRKLGMSSTMGIFDAAMGLGMIVGPLASGIIMDYFGIAYVFYIGGLLSGLGMGIFWFLARENTDDEALFA
jgi:MFS transporter, DHA1 family, multidrug resistance protein